MLLRAIDACEGQTSMALALRITPQVFARPGELRAAEWAAFDLSATVGRGAVETKHQTACGG
jgi:hypothetical protein